MKPTAAGGSSRGHAQPADVLGVDDVVRPAAEELLAHVEVDLAADDPRLGVQALGGEHHEGVVLVRGQHGEDAGGLGDAGRFKVSSSVASPTR